MLGGSCIKKGCIGCGGTAVASAVLFAGLWLFAPWVFDSVIDWVLFVDPPRVAISQNGPAEVKKAIRDLYVSVEGDSPPSSQTVVISEGAANGLLGDPSDKSALRATRVDLGGDSATMYAAIDLRQLAQSKDYSDLMSSVPEFLRDRRVSVRVEFSKITTANNRLNFEDISVKVGRVWVPFSGDWALPIIQRVAEKKLGTRLPEEGLPLPPGSSAHIADDKLTVTLGNGKR